ncbi:multicystatin-like [Rhododendron vialii]|uniref:multicystatin-like n=1 Tax=Rhododendron vialii TaxID=182163 RepID=UPI00265E5C3E|nr:multicystatin-like [Rhododendron vialii]
MEIGKVLFQKDVEGIPKPTFEGAVQVQLSNPDFDDAAKYAIKAYNEEQGTHLEFGSVISGWDKDLAILGTLYLVVFFAKDGDHTMMYFAAVHKTLATKILLPFIYIAG